MDSGLLEQLGINWKLFLSQAVNFIILLVILSYFLYKPLLKILKERRKKIEEGLEKAKEADIRLKEIDGLAKEKIKEAEGKSVEIIKDTQTKAKQMEISLQKKAEERQKELLEKIQAGAKRSEEEAKQAVLKSASDIVKRVIAKTVELSPKDIDDKLIEKAIETIKNEN